MSVVLHPAPRFASNEGVIEAVSATLGARLIEAREAVGEVILTVERAAVAEALQLLRDKHEYQQLMEIAGVDYPDRAQRFEVVYMLLSLTRNHRLLVKVTAAEDLPVPTVTDLWPVAGWLEREVFDLYGVIFEGNTDLRRILTDYGFEGHPFRKDFPLTGYVELRYSEEDKRVVYEPVKLAQDLRSFDFMSPWEGADYVLPGDEKAVQTPPPPTAAPAVPQTTAKPADTGAGKESNKASGKKVARPGAPKVKADKEPGAPKPTSSRPTRKPRKKSADAKPSTAPEGS